MSPGPGWIVYEVALRGSNRNEVQVMGSIKRNLGFFSALSLALVIGGTAAVVAQGPAPAADSEVSDGVTLEEMTQMRGREGRAGFRRGFRDHGGRRDRGGRGFRDRSGFRSPIRLGLAGGVIRTETIVDAGEDGFVTHRNERGEVTVVSDSAISISLANGETSDIVITDDTSVLGVAGSSSGRRQRVRIVESSVADIGVGDSAMVTSRSIDGADFEATRIVAIDLTESEAADDAVSDAADVDAASASLQSS